MASLIGPTEHCGGARHRSRRVLAGLLAVGLGIAATTLMAGAPARARGGPTSVAPVAEKLMDSVVNISTSQIIKGPQGVPLPKMPKGAPFSDFFDDFFDKKGKQQQQKVASLGSGFVIDPSGLIATNNHVIEGADEIVVNFHDGTKLKVDKVLGRDSKTDVALLKVTPKKPLSAVKFGSSDQMRVGDWVMAIGNPFGLGGSLTVGVISAKQRDIQSGPYDDYLQTDASINKGNSGGPLFNMDGEVIGINTAIISPTGGSIGIGFAIPSDTALPVVEQLRQYGETRRGWLGVQLSSVDEDTAESLGLKDPTGAFIAKVTENGPAAKAGIRPTDIVTKFDGRDVETMRSLPRLVAQAAVGKTVDVEFIRDGKKQTVKVTLGRLEDGDKAVATSEDKGAAEPPDKATPRTLLGMSLVPLTEAQRAKLNIDKKVKGVLVKEVDGASAAAQKGIKAGDIITEIQQAEVATPDELLAKVEEVRRSKRTAVLVMVTDAKGDIRFVGLPLAD